MKKRTVAILLAIVLVFGAAVGGTLAWLMSTPASVENTFTAGDVAIELTENGGVKWEKQMIPGTTYAKNPVVTVKDTTNVDCYVFVKFDANDAAKTYLKYDFTLDDLNSGWTQGTGDAGNKIPTNVWYKELKTTDSPREWHLLAGDQVKVLESVTKDNMSTASTAKLTFTAYAVQKDNLDVAAAWALVG